MTDLSPAQTAGPTPEEKALRWYANVGNIVAIPAADVPLLGLFAREIIRLRAENAELRAEQDESYYAEVQRVSELLTDYDPTDRFSSVSEHLAHVIKLWRNGAVVLTEIARSELSSRARPEPMPSHCKACSRLLTTVASANGVDLVCMNDDCDDYTVYAARSRSPEETGTPLSEEERSFVKDVALDADDTRSTYGQKTIKRLLSLVDRLSSVATGEEPDDEDTLTVERIRGMDGENVLDLFCNAFGWPNAVIEDDEENEGGYIIRIDREEFDEGIEAYLTRVVKTLAYRRASDPVERPEVNRK